MRVNNNGLFIDFQNAMFSSSDDEEGYGSIKEKVSETVS